MATVRKNQARLTQQEWQALINAMSALRSMGAPRPRYGTFADEHVRAMSMDGTRWGAHTVSQMGMVGFRWRPFIGTEFSSTVDLGGVDGLKSEEDYSRFTSKLLGELWLGNRGVLVGDYVHRTELNGEQRSFNYSEVSAVLLLDERIEADSDANHFSVGVTWKHGEDAPTFKDVDAFTAWFGVRF